jgi:methionyl-tRNA synthetase
MVSFNTSRRYFFVPATPTPNGRLHLGHIAGPFLRMDMMARFLRCRGHDVRVISSVDSFDTSVLVTAVQQRKPAGDVCDFYRRRIVSDLKALDIDVEEVTDVIHGSTASQHAAGAQDAIRTLVRRGLIETITERVLYSKSTDRYVVGAWLTGRCPHCDAAAGGFFCEACGNFFRPETMVEPTPRLGDTNLEWREVDSLFLRIEDTYELEQKMIEAGASDHFISIARRFLQRDKGLFRLTSPGTWGIPWEPDKRGNPRVLFTSGWEYALSCGSYYMQSSADHLHPMSRKSEIVSAASFGIDNAVMVLVGCTAVLTALGHSKPFDYLFTNYFYNLEGRKFSTSRLHVIWAGDIVNKTPAGSDAVRFFLALNSPEEFSTDFVVSEFIAFRNDLLSDKLSCNISRALSSCNAAAISEPDAELSRRLDSCYEDQNRAFCLKGPSVRRAASALARYCKAEGLDLTDPTTSYWWLKGLSLLCAPIMPQISSTLWRKIGGEGDPNFFQAYEITTPSALAENHPAFAKLTPDALRPCLPLHLANEMVAL